MDRVGSYACGQTVHVSALREVLLIRVIRISRVKDRVKHREMVAVWRLVGIPSSDATMKILVGSREAFRSLGPVEPKDRFLVFRWRIAVVTIRSRQGQRVCVPTV